MSTFTSNTMKDSTMKGSMTYVSPQQITKKRAFEVADGLKKKKLTFQHNVSILNRVLVATIEDDDHAGGLHHVFGYLKHWFDKDYIKLKRNQILSDVKWWRDHHVDIYHECCGKYDIETILDKFLEVVMEESNNIIDILEEFDHFVINVLNQEALGHCINRKENDPVTFFLYNLIHCHNITLYKAECYMVAFETITVFEHDGVVVGELVLDAGKKMKWMKHE